MESPAKNDTAPLSKPSSSAAANPRRRRLCVRSAAIAAALALAIIIVAVVLSQTVFKPKRPITTVTAVSLKDLDASILGRRGVGVNVTVAVDLSVENPNKVGFQYGDSAAALNYRGEQVGEAAIPGGEISAGETEQLNVTLTLMADRLLSRSEVYSDVLAGDLPLSSYTRIAGRVTILGIFKLHIVSTTLCDFNVDVSNRTISDQRCTYKTKL